LVDALVRDCGATLVAIDGESLEGAAKAAAELLAVVAGQDVDENDDGVFRIARRVAADRVISTVGHRGPARPFFWGRWVSRGVLGSGCDGHSGHTLCVWVRHVRNCESHRGLC